MSYEIDQLEKLVKANQEYKTAAFRLGVLTVLFNHLGVNYSEELFEAIVAEYEKVSELKIGKEKSNE